MTINEFAKNFLDNKLSNEEKIKKYVDEMYNRLVNLDWSDVDKRRVDVINEHAIEIHVNESNVQNIHRDLVADIGISTDLYNEYSIRAERYSGVYKYSDESVKRLNVYKNDKIEFTTDFIKIRF